MGRPIVSFVEIHAPQANRDENHARPLARSRDLPWHAAAFVLLRTMVVVVAPCCLGACKQQLVVGEYCPVSIAEGGSPPSSTAPISVPWAAGFEDQFLSQGQFCEFLQVAGFCYSYPPASYRVVTSPVHSGQFAAEFTVLTGTDAGAQPQARCVRQGVLPTAGYYGAWYYIPATATNTGLWNLFHIQGGNADATSIHGLWDVSLGNGPNGELRAHVYGFLDGSVGDGPPIPIARWFQLELYLKRAKDKTGEVALYQDGSQVVNIANLITDDTDWAQWYVGNLASALDPPQSTVYVDDITIRATP